MTTATMDPAKIEQLSDEVRGVVEKCPSAMASDADMQAATTWLAAVRQRRKEIEKFFTDLIKPIQQAVKQQQAKRDEILAPLAERENRLNLAILHYRNEQQRRAQAEQAKANAAYDKKVAKAEEKGKDVSLIPPPRQVEAPAKTVETGIGAAVTFRTIRKFEVVNPELVPEEYWMIDETKIGKVVRAGVDVPGCRIWEEEVTSIR